MIAVTVLHGPNLNLLGTREPHVYGTATLAQIDEELRRRGAARECAVHSYQESGEGALIDRVHQAASGSRGLIINAAGYSHTSIALRDAVAAVGLPAVEVHLSNVYRRERFRHRSLLAGACLGVIAGFGARSYTLALDALIDHIEGARP